jgi:phosphoenolpyruvate carboxykinase (GTP)
VRVLKWILERVEGRGAAQETPIGHVPARGALTLDGLNIPPETVDELLRVDPEDWEQELADTKEFFQKFGDRLPRELRDEHDKLARRLGRTAGVAR